MGYRLALGLVAVVVLFGQALPIPLEESLRVSNLKINKNFKSLSAGRFSPLAFGCIGNGAVDDRECLQRMFAAVDEAGGGTVELPSGYIFRVTDFIQARGNSLIIRGGGSIFCDPAVNSSGHPYFNQIGSVYRSCLVVGRTSSAVGVQSDADDARTAITGGQDVGLTLEDFTIYSTGKYLNEHWNTLDEPKTNIPLRHSAIAIWAVDQVDIRGLRIHSFGTDALELWGVTNMVIAYNRISNIGFNGIGIFASSDYTITGNMMHEVGQGIEATTLRAVITGNIITKTAMSGIWGGGQGSNLSNSYVTIFGNILQGDVTANGYPIQLNCASGDGCLKASVLHNNVVLGGWATPITIHGAQAP